MSEDNNIKIKAKLTRAPVTTRKAGLVAKDIRGIKVDDALSYLQFSNYKASKILHKLIKSGVANAKEKNIDQDQLIIEEILIGPGLTLPNRGMIGARGRFKPMRKRSSNIAITLSSIDNLGENNE